MSGRLIMDSKAVVNRMSRRQFRRVILAAGLTRSVRPVSDNLLVRIKTLLPALLFCV